MQGEQIVAVALLNEPTFRMLKSSLKRVYRIDDTPRFDALLKALDDLDAEGAS
jgi:hypothetical protein